MNRSEQINEIATACAKAQCELRPAVKDATNPAFRSKYADEAAIRDASRTYAQHGVAIFQEATTSERGIAVVTMFAHTSGQWLEFGPLTVPMGKQDAHGVGSATTYAKRYSLQAAAGIAADDDDGNAASEVQRPHAKPEAVIAPAGFGEWLKALDLTAKDGAGRLQEVWNASKLEYRKHLTSTDPKRWEEVKAKAAKVPVAVPA